MVSNPIDPAAFAANLRVEIYRQRGGQGAQLFFLINQVDDKGLGPAFSASPQHVFGVLSRTLDGTQSPTPAEVAALSSALGCPDSRLLVSREELEAENEMMRAQLAYLDEHVLEVLRDSVTIGEDAVRQRARADGLEMRLAELKGSVACMAIGREQSTEEENVRVLESEVEGLRCFNRSQADSISILCAAEQRLRDRVTKLKAQRDACREGISCALEALEYGIYPKGVYMTRKALALALEILDEKPEAMAHG